MQCNAIPAAQVTMMPIKETPEFLTTVSCYLQVPGHKAVFINEPKLSDFKQVLLKEGISAEFSAGVLVCNNTVAIRRVSPWSLFFVVEFIIQAFFLWLPVYLLSRWSKETTTRTFRKIKAKQRCQKFLFLLWTANFIACIFLCRRRQENFNWKDV